MAHRPNQPAIPFIRLWARERPVSMPQRTRNRTRRFPEDDSPRDYRWCQSDAALSPRSSGRTVFCHFDPRSITAWSSADTTTAVNRAVDRHVRGCHVCTETRTRPRHPHIIIYPCASTSPVCQASRANKPRTGVRKDGEAQCPAMC